MSQTGVTAFDSTIQTTNIWLNDIRDRLGWQDRQRTYGALRSVLHALRDHLSVDQAAALGAQLPMLVRGFYYEGWHPAGKPTKERSKDDFLAQVAEQFGGDLEIDIEHMARTVLEVLGEHISGVAHVKVVLPRELRSLWSDERHTLWF
jgi:uncharacterized protein (DUF2267 family)